MVGLVKVIGTGLVGAIVGAMVGARVSQSSNNKKYDTLVDEYVDACLTARIVGGMSIVDLKAYIYNIIPDNTGYPVNKIFNDVVHKAENILDITIV